MERNEFIEKYVASYIRNWAELIPLMRPGQEYVDDPNSMVRIVALAQASALWELMFAPGT